jgi:hypothetical protein
MEGEAGRVDRPAAAAGSSPTATMISAAVDASARRSSAASVCAWVARVSKLNGRITSVAGSSFITSTNTSRPAVSRLPRSIGMCTRRSVAHLPKPRLREASSMLGVILPRLDSTVCSATARKRAR